MHGDSIHNFSINVRLSLNKTLTLKISKDDGCSICSRTRNLLLHQISASFPHLSLNSYTEQIPGQCWALAYSFLGFILG